MVDLLKKKNAMYVGVAVVVILAVLYFAGVFKKDDDKDATTTTAEPAGDENAENENAAPQLSANSITAEPKGEFATVNGAMLATLLGVNKLQKPMLLQKHVTSNLTTGEVTEEVKYTPNKLMRSRLEEVAHTMATIKLYEPGTTNHPSWAGVHAGSGLSRAVFEIPCYVYAVGNAFDVTLGSFVLPRSFAGRTVKATLDFNVFQSPYNAEIASVTIPVLTAAAGSSVTLDFQGITGTIRMDGGDASVDETVNSVVINVPRDLIKAAQDANLQNSSVDDRLLVKFWIDNETGGDWETRKGTMLDVIYFEDAITLQTDRDNTVVLRVGQSLSQKNILMEAHVASSNSLSSTFLMIAKGELGLPVIDSVLTTDRNNPIGQWTLTRVEGGAIVTMSTDGSGLEAGQKFRIPMPGLFAGSDSLTDNTAMVVEMVLRPKDTPAYSDASVEIVPLSALAPSFASNEYAADVALTGPQMTVEEARVVTGKGMDFTFGAVDSIDHMTLDGTTMLLTGGPGIYHIPFEDDSMGYAGYIKVINSPPSSLRKAHALRVQHAVDKKRKALRRHKLTSTTGDYGGQYGNAFDGFYFDAPNNEYSFPTGAADWAGVSLQGDYPSGQDERVFNNDGTITFNASAAVDTTLIFRFEKDLFPNAEPSREINYIVNTTTMSSHTVTIPADATGQTYKNVVLKIAERDQAVFLDNLQITSEIIEPPASVPEISGPAPGDWEGSGFVRTISLQDNHLFDTPMAHKTEIFPGIFDYETFEIVARSTGSDWNINGEHVYAQDWDTPAMTSHNNWAVVARNNGSEYVLLILENKSITDFNIVGVHVIPQEIYAEERISLSTMFTSNVTIAYASTDSMVGPNGQGYYMEPDTQEVVSWGSVSGDYVVFQNASNPSEFYAIATMINPLDGSPNSSGINLAGASSVGGSSASGGYTHTGNNPAFPPAQDVNTLQDGDLHFYAWMRKEEGSVSSQFITMDGEYASVDLSFVDNVAPRLYEVAQLNIFRADMNLTSTQNALEGNWPTQVGNPDGVSGTHYNGSRWMDLFDTGSLGDVYSNDTIMGVERLSYMRAGNEVDFDLGAQRPTLPNIALTEAALAVTTVTIPLLLQSFVATSVPTVGYGVNFNDSRRANDVDPATHTVGSTTSAGAAHVWTNSDRPDGMAGFFFPHTAYVQANDQVYAVMDGNEMSYGVTMEDVAALDGIMHTFVFANSYTSTGATHSANQLRVAKSSDLLFSARSAKSSKARKSSGAAKSSKKRGVALRSVASGMSGSTRK